MVSNKHIKHFPIKSWIQKYVRTYDSGGEVLYADCFCCGGRRKLGIYLRNRIAVCGRCKDGGHGGEVWSGVAGLPKLIKLLTNWSWTAVFDYIKAQTYFPDEEAEEPLQLPILDIPPTSIPLSECSPKDIGNLFLESRGVGHLKECSYICTRGKYKDRVIVPTAYIDEVFGFEAKSIYKSIYPKALYPAGMKTNDVLYTAKNWDFDSSVVVVTESVFDAEAFHTLNINAVGCFGGFKPGQLSALLQLNAEKVYWFLDGDAWGKVQNAVTTGNSFFRNYVVKFNRDEDPSSVGRDRLHDLYRTAKEIKTIWEFYEVSFNWGKM